MKLIKLSADHYVIVDDSEIKDVRPYIDMYHLEDGNTINKFPTYLTDLSSCKLIIYSTQPLEYTTEDHLQWDKIKRLSISEVKELIGEVDVENKAIEWYNGQSKYYNSNYVADPYSWKKGYDQSLEDNKDKRFTYNEILTIAIRCWNTAADPMQRSVYNLNKIVDEYIQRLEPTEWEVEFIDGKLKLI